MYIPGGLQFHFPEEEKRTVFLALRDSINLGQTAVQHKTRDKHSVSRVVAPLQDVEEECHQDEEENEEEEEGAGHKGVIAVIETPRDVTLRTLPADN